MKIFVKAKAGAKEEKVEAPQAGLWEEKGAEGKSFYKVWVKERPVQGQANIAITKALAKYFGVSISQVSLLSGHTSKQKVFEIGRH